MAYVVMVFTGMTYIFMVHAVMVNIVMSCIISAYGIMIDRSAAGHFFTHVYTLFFFSFLVGGAQRALRCDVRHQAACDVAGTPAYMTIAVAVEPWPWPFSHGL